MANYRKHEGFSRTVYAYSNNNIDGVMIYCPKNKNISKLEIILIIFKCCVSETYPIVLLPNLERMYDHIHHIDRQIISLY